MIKRTLLFTFAALMTASAFAQEDAASAAEAEAEPAVVVTSEGLVDRCILPLIITEVNGEAIEEDAGRYEFEAGSQSFSGYSQGDFSACATIAEAGLGADSPIGEGSTTVKVPAGKEYYLGLDVRKSDPKTWKVVTWRINH
jgi:hypothetical protein